METPPVGSLVVPSPSFRSAMSTGEGAALLLALRRGSGHLFYPATERAFWVPTRDFRAIPREAVAQESLEGVLSDLLLFLDAEECDLELLEQGALRLSVDVPETSREGLRALESRLGPRLRDYEIAPRNMHALTLHLRLVSLPEPQRPGT